MNTEDEGSLMAPLYRLVRTLVKQHNDTARARAIANRLRTPNFRTALLAEIALAQLERGDAEGASETAREILTLHEQGQEVEEGDVALATALLGKYKDAFALAERIQENSFTPSLRATAFGNIAYLQAVAGDLKGARQTMKQAAKHDQSRSFEVSANPLFRADLARLATHYQEAIPPLRVVEALVARQRLEDALKIAQSMKDSAERSYALAAVANAQVAAGALAEAERTIVLDREVIGAPGIDALLTLADAYTQHQQPAQAMGVLHHVIELHLSRKWYREDFVQRDTILQRGAKALAQAGASQALSEWISLAKLLSALDLQEAIKQVQATARPEDPSVLAGSIAEIAGTMGHYLIRIQTFEQQLSPQPLSEAHPRHEPTDAHGEFR